MKNLILLFVTVCLFSCSKDNETPAIVFQEQNPLEAFLIGSFNKATYENVNTSDIEYGFSFIPSVTGNITAVTIKIPDIQNGLRVTIWDKTTGAVLRTENVDISTAGITITKKIAVVNLII